jgi:hypothetical protein
MTTCEADTQDVLRWSCMAYGVCVADEHSEEYFALCSAITKTVPLASGAITFHCESFKYDYTLLFDVHNWTRVHCTVLRSDMTKLVTIFEETAIDALHMAIKFVMNQESQ